MPNPRGIEAGNAYVRLWAEQSELRRNLGEAKTRIRAFAGDINALGSKLLGGGILAGAGIGLAARDFAAVDDNLRAIQGIASATAEELAELEDRVRSLGATTSFTAQEVAEAAKELARGGQDIARINQTLASVLDLSRGTGTALDIAAASVVRTLGQFGLAADESGRVVDVLAKSANSGTFVLEDLTESLKFLGPIASELGETVETTAAAFAVLANNGLRGGIAGRQLRRVLFELSNSAKQVRIKELFDVDVADSRGNLRPLVDLVDEIGAGLRELPSGTRVNLLDEIFGEGAAAFAGLAKGADDLRGLNTELLVSGGYAEDLAKNIDEGLGGAIRITVSVLRDLSIGIGKLFSEDLVAGAKVIQGYVRDTLKWAQANRDTVVAVGKLTAAAVALGGAMVGLAAVVATVGTALAVIGPGMPAIVGLTVLAGVLTPVISGLVQLDLATGQWVDNAGRAVSQTDLLLGRLEELSSLRALDSSQFNEAIAIVQTLEQKFGDLGVEFDELKGKAGGLADAIERVGVSQSIGNIESQIDGLSSRRERLQRQIEGTLDSRGIATNATIPLLDEVEQIDRMIPFLRSELELRRDELAALGEAAETEIRANRNGVQGERLRQNYLNTFRNLGQLVSGGFDAAEKQVEENGVRGARFAAALAAVGDTAGLLGEGKFRSAQKRFSTSVALLQSGIISSVTGAADALVEQGRQAQRERIDRALSSLSGVLNDTQLGRRGGSFGARDLANRQGSELVNLQQRLLAVQETEVGLLKMIREAIARNGGLPVGGA